MKYLPRVADKMLQERLEAFGAVLIEGPKWTGKTTTAEQQAKSVIKLQNPDKVNEYLATAKTRPSLLLKGEQPRLIDEWQDAPMLWDAVRTAVDETGGIPGQYILTGSNTVDKSQIRHTGTGRITRMKMYPMSLWESLEKYQYMNCSIILIMILMERQANWIYPSCFMSLVVAVGQLHYK